MDPNRANWALVMSTMIVGLVLLLVVRRIVGLFRWSARLVIGLLIVIVIALAWWSAKSSHDRAPVYSDWQTHASPQLPIRR
jgi:hypothetical protein